MAMAPGKAHRASSLLMARIARPDSPFPVRGGNGPAFPTDRYTGIPFDEAAARLTQLETRTLAATAGAAGPADWQAFLATQQAMLTQLQVLSQEIQRLQAARAGGQPVLPNMPPLAPPLPPPPAPALPPLPPSPLPLVPPPPAPVGPGPIAPANYVPGPSPAPLPNAWVTPSGRPIPAWLQPMQPPAGPPVAPPVTPAGVVTPAAIAGVPEMRQRAMIIWHNFANDLGGKLGGKVERDPISVNKLTAERQEQATKELTANKAVEAAAFQRLSPAQQAAYNHVAGATLQDPNAHLALQILLCEGTLTAGVPSKDGQNLLDTLAGISAQPVHDAIDKSDLIGDLIQEIALPPAINQWERGTCTVTSVQILMATKWPAEYARLIGGLAGTEGQVTTASGRDITRYQGTSTADGTSRSVPSRLWQPAMMQFARGGPGTYANTERGGGLDWDGVARVMATITGKKIDNMHNRRGWDLEAVIAKIRQSTDMGDPVVIGAMFEGRFGHEVLVRRIVEDRVYYDNPQGTQDSIGLDAFKRNIDSAHFIDLDGNNTPAQALVVPTPFR